jgi:hypothetical protein
MQLILVNAARYGYSRWCRAARRNGGRTNLRERSVGQINFEDGDVI